jgi:wyosine [tRNA(Phe)-imidazoG37] synthetase (radical SAM superfamily)
VAVLTNGSLLSQADVQESLMAADVVLPSLNTALPQTFRAVHRPAAIKFETVIDGLIQFRHLFKKEIWLEVFLLRVYNDDAENLEALKQAIQRVQPDKVQLNTVTRPPAEDFAYHLSSEEMNQVCKLFGPGTEVIAERELIIPQTTIGMDDRSRILSLLTRRPCKLPEITNSLGLEEAKVFKYIAELENEGKIRYTVIKEQIYYHLRAEARKTLSS